MKYKQEQPVYDLQLYTNSNKMQQHQIINALLNLDDLFEQLNKLRFKGRQLVQQLINILYERKVINEQSRKETTQNRRLVFETAERNCLEVIGAQICKIQSELVENYIAIVNKVTLNVEYLNRETTQSELTEVTTSKNLILLELISLAIGLGSQYQHQKSLIWSHWQQINLQLMLKVEESQEKLKQLMLHVGFQSWVDDKHVECWRQKLLALSNQRYNPKKD